MIHRDHRKAYESASALGQIVWREGPAALTVSDVDLVGYKRLSAGGSLLRIVEQKQPNHQLNGPQRSLLQLLDETIRHYVTCGTSRYRLDPRSGVYLVWGEIAGEMEGNHRTAFQGPQLIERLATGEERPAVTHEDFFKFLDPESPTRRRMP